MILATELIAAHGIGNGDIRVIARVMIALLIVMAAWQIIRALAAFTHRMRERIYEVHAIRYRTRFGLIATFAEVRQIRLRLRPVLRFEVVTNRPHIAQVPFDLYRASVDDLSELRNRLEELETDIKSHRRAFPQASQALINVSSMRSYIETIVNEAGALERRSISLAQVPHFGDLIGEYRRSRYRTQFVLQYHRALRLIVAI